MLKTKMRQDKNEPRKKNEMQEKKQQKNWNTARQKRKTNQE